MEPQPEKIMAKFSYKDCEGNGDKWFWAYGMDGTENSRLGRKNVYLVRCSSADLAFIEKERLKQTVGSTGQKMNTVGTISKATHEWNVKDYLRKNGMVVASVRTVK